VRLPRLVATDLDGTLLRPDGTISSRTARVLREVDAAGVTVVFVTARPPRWIDAIAGSVAGHGTVICGNGAFVYDVASREVLAVNGFGHDLVQAIVRDVRGRVGDVTFAAERSSGLWFEPGFAHDAEHPVPDDAIEAPIETLPGPGPWPRATSSTSSPRSWGSVPTWPTRAPGVWRRSTPWA
jgi:HAD superfamily hydrolase (TIGR01484 family)